MMIFIFSTLMGLTVGLVVWFSGTVVEERRQRRHLFELVDPTRIYPNRWVLFLREHRHRKERFHLFPDFLDLLGLGVSAGLTLERAWSVALEKMPMSFLKEDLLLFEQIIRWGRSRREAFQEVSKRLSDPHLVMILVLIERAMSQGQALREVVMGQARALRQMRWIQLERRAQTAGLRMLIPIFIFILPAVFLILFAPLLISLSNGASLFF